MDRGSYDDGGESFGIGTILGGLGMLAYKEYVDRNVGLEVAIPVIFGTGVLFNYLLNRTILRPRNRESRLVEDSESDNLKKPQNTEQLRGRNK